MRTRILVLAVGLACAFFAWWVCSRIFSEGPISKYSFERIKEGMALKEVEEIIGLPAGDYGYRKRCHQLGWVLFMAFDKEENLKRWGTDEVVISVLLSPEGTVTEKSFCELPSP